MVTSSNMIRSDKEIHTQRAILLEVGYARSNAGSNRVIFGSKTGQSHLKQLLEHFDTFLTVSAPLMLGRTSCIK